MTCTDGGWVPESARWPEATIDVPVGAVRAFDFQADYAGDWALHCHKIHHTMNAMGHDLNTYIGVDLGEARRKIARVVGGDYHPMGSRGMAEMGAMEMPAPDNTLPMMTGFGQFGPDRNGRHVHGRESARGPRRQRLRRPRLVPASPGQRRLRMARRAADASERAAAGAQGRNAAAAKQGCAQGVSPQTRASPLMRALTTTFDDKGPQLRRRETSPDQESPHA